MIRAFRRTLRAARFALVEVGKLARTHRRLLKRQHDRPAAPVLAAPAPTTTRAREPSDPETPYQPILDKGAELAKEYEQLERELELENARGARRAQEQLFGGGPPKPEPIPQPPPPPPPTTYRTEPTPASSGPTTRGQRLAAAMGAQPPPPAPAEAPPLPAPPPPGEPELAPSDPAT